MQEYSYAIIPINSIIISIEDKKKNLKLLSIYSTGDIIYLITSQCEYVVLYLEDKKYELVHFLNTVTSFLFRLKLHMLHNKSSDNSEAGRQVAVQVKA